MRSSILSGGTRVWTWGIKHKAGPVRVLNIYISYTLRSHISMLQKQILADPTYHSILLYLHYQPL
jgi:hypothetical protein